MESSFAPTPAKRGCLWYTGVAAVGIFGLTGLLIITGVLDAVNGISPHSVLVSADENTYLEAVTSNHGEGFLDGYDWLEVYYVHDGWFWNDRVRVYNFPSISASQIRFNRSVGKNGQVQIQIKQGGIGDSVVLATFVPPVSFPDK